MGRLSIETQKRELTVTKSAGDIIRRITPLGFTDEEAIGWYRNNVQYNWSLRFVIAFLSGFALVLVDAFENAYLQSSLMIDMILQHFVHVMVGILFAYAAYCTVFIGFSVKLSKVCGVGHEENFSDQSTWLRIFRSGYFDNLLLGSPF